MSLALPVAASPLGPMPSQPIPGMEQAAALADGAMALQLFGAALEEIILAAGQEGSAPEAGEDAPSPVADARESGSDAALPGMAPTLLAATSALPMPAVAADNAASSNAPAVGAPATFIPMALAIATPVGPSAPTIAVDAPASPRPGVRHPASDRSQDRQLPSSATPAPFSGSAASPVLQTPDSASTADRQPPLAATGESTDGGDQHNAGSTPAAALPGAGPAGAQAASAGPSLSPPAAVKVPAGAPEQWRQPLLKALGERIQVQLANRSEQAVIRLDPGSLGTVEVVIRHQAGALQVQLNASNGEVLRQLHSIGDSLRHDLAQGQYADVSVQISNHGRDGDGRQRQRQDTPEPALPGRALAEAEAGLAGSRFALSSDSN